jgi:hypothetical protein
MDQVQRNGGVAGIVAGGLLILLVILTFSLGADVMAPGDPARALSAVTQKWSLWVFASLVGVVTTGAAVLFTVGLTSRVRDQAPTRARAILYFVLIGLTGYALASIVPWVGGAQVVAYAAKDQAAAANAWLVLNAVSGSFAGLGGAFVGAGTLIAGWVIIATRTMGSGIGWLGVVAGILGILSLFAPGAFVVGLGGTVLTAVWLAWTGSVLRSA